MQRLIPDPGPTDIDTELADYRPFESPLEDRPYVAVNMVTTLDGRASLGGRTVEMGTPLDIELLLRLRTRFDAVMIGAGTMRAARASADAMIRPYLSARIVPAPIITASKRVRSRSSSSMSSGVPISTVRPPRLALPSSVVTMLTAT